MKLFKNLKTKEYSIYETYSGIYKIYITYYLFGFIIIYAKDLYPYFRSKKMAEMYINILKEQDAKNNA